MNSDPTFTVDAPTLHSERQSAHWDLKNALRNYSTLVVAQITVALFSFASVWLITHYLGTEGYGGVVAVIAASQVAQILVNWTCVSLARYGVEEFVETGHITKSFWARTAIFLPNTLLLLISGPLWLPLLSDWLKLPPETIWFVAAHFAVTAIWSHIQYAMQSAKLPRLQGVLQAVERVSLFVVLFFLVLLGKLDGLTAISAYIAAPLLMAIIGTFAIRKLFSWRTELDLKTIRTLLRFSLPLIPYSLIGYFSTNYLDAIFISQYLTKSDLGIYSVAYQINGILMQFPLSAGSLLLPLFVTLRSGGASERVTTYIERVLPFLTFVGGVACIFAALVMKFFIPLVFGDQVEQAVIIFWILMSSAAIAIPVVIGFGPFTNALSATYVAAIVALVGASANLLGNYLLIPKYGLKGCAWATVLAYGASTLAAIAIVQIRFGLRHVWTIPALIPTLIASTYASLTGDLLIAFSLALATAFAIVFIWRSSVAEAIRFLKNYRAFAA